MSKQQQLTVYLADESRHDELCEIVTELVRKFGGGTIDTHQGYICLNRTFCECMECRKLRYEGLLKDPPVSPAVKLIKGASVPGA